MEAEEGLQQSSGLVEPAANDMQVAGPSQLPQVDRVTDSISSRGHEHQVADPAVVDHNEELSQAQLAQNLREFQIEDVAAHPPSTQIEQVGLKRRKVED